MKTTKPELDVPRAAWEDTVRAVATPLVVAELRAQAALIRRSAKYGPSDAWMTHKLERRADDLEAGA